MLCLATYNIWNSETGMPFRENCIVREIIKINPDIICLQEVKDKCLAESLAENLGMNSFFCNYPKQEEGICILCKHPVNETVSWIGDANAQYACCHINNINIGIVNLHLPWDSVKAREKCMVSIIKRLKEKKADYVFVLGDFNSGNYSDVFRFMLGECTMEGEEANPCFYDLAQASEQVYGVAIKDTVNFRENPRFVRNTIEVNQRFDRIYMQNTYPREFPKLLECDVFGTKLYSEIGLAASDHYGVYAKLEISEMESL